MQSQEFNARAKQGVDEYNQQAQFSQLEDPRRRREGIIDTQKRTDAQGALDYANKEKNYNLTKEYIENTFNPWGNTNSNIGIQATKAKNGGKVKIKPKKKK